MRRMVIVEASLWLGAALLVLFAVAVSRGRTAPSVAAPLIGGGPASPRVIGPELLARAAAVTVQRDPFRLARRPSDVAYSPDLAGAPPPPPAPPKPTLTLKGVVGGPPWQAVLEGIPGRDGGVLLGKGDTLGGLKVQAVGPDTVVVRGMDTTWKLTVKRAWQ